MCLDPLLEYEIFKHNQRQLEREAEIQRHLKEIRKFHKIPHRQHLPKKLLRTCVYKVGCFLGRVMKRKVNKEVVTPTHQAHTAYEVVEEETFVRSS